MQYLSIKVIANAPVSELRGTMADGTMKIAIAAEKEKGKANEELIRFLSDYLHIPRAQIRIKSGFTKSKKIVAIV